MENFYSESSAVMIGIRQGSVFRPILFLLYTNDLPTVIDASITLTNYADDTYILIPRENYLDLEKDTIKAVSAIANWLSENTLVLNIGKTNCVTFRHSRNKNGYPSNIKLVGTVTEYAHSGKFLGVHNRWKP